MGFVADLSPINDRFMAGLMPASPKFQPIGTQLPDRLYLVPEWRLGYSSREVCCC